MKKTLAILVTGCLACLSAFAVSGQEGMAEDADAKARAESERKARKAEDKDQKARQLHGTGWVLKVEGAGIQVRLRNKGTVTLAVDPGTIVLRGRNAAKLEEVKAGQRVRVIYESRENGNVAREIHVLPAMATSKGHEKAKEKPKETTEKP